MLQMGSSRNRDPLKLSRDEDPSWDLEEPPKPRRKPSRTYFMLFIIKIFINHHLAVTSLNLNWFQVLKCIFSGRRYDALRMVVQTQFFGWKFSQLGTYLFWTLHLCSYQCPPLGPSSLSWISTADDGYCCLCQTATQDMSCMQSKVCSTAQELTGSQHSSWNIVHKLSPQPALRNCKEAARLLIFGICSCYWWNASNVSALVVNTLWKGGLWYVSWTKITTQITLKMTTRARH